MLTGQTVIDGPELIWQQCFKETNAVSVGDGYQSRNWECFPQFVNINIDMFRKIIDKTIRIPSRKEVIDRTKVVILQDVYSGDDNAKYAARRICMKGFTFAMMMDIFGIIIVTLRKRAVILRFLLRSNCVTM